MARIDCGTLDRLSRAFASLDLNAIIATTPSQRNTTDAMLRNRIPAYEM